MKLNIKLLHLLVSALFFSLLMVFWGVFYPEHLIQKEQMQLFLLGGEYLWGHLTYQGGFAIYAGEFLTQFFIFPWVGAIVLSGLALSLYLSVRKILNILWGNRIYVLALAPALSYTFLLFNDFYYVSGILALCVSGWLIVAYIKISNPKIRILVGIVFLMLLYWLFGGAYLVFAASIVLIEILTRVFNDLSLLGIKNIGLIGYLLLVVIIPLFARYFLVTDTFLQSYFSTAYYKFRLVFPTSIIFIFLSFPIIVLYYGMIHRLLSDRIVRFLQYVCVLLLLVYGGYGFYQFSDFEMEREMKYDNMVVNQQWEEIIATADHTLPTGRQGRLALMLALGKMDLLSTRMFSFQPELSDFFIPYGVHGMAPLIANEPYFHLGLINFSQMLAMETIESTPDAVMPVRAVKRYAETCIITGQYDVAEKFLRYLQKTFFYKQWADEAMQFLHHDEKVNAHPIWGKLRAMQVKDDLYFQFDHKDLSLICLLRSDNRNRLAYEYLMAFYLLRKDFDNFLKFFPLMEGLNLKEIPIVYQQALVYIETLLPDSPNAFANLSIQDEVRRRIKIYADAFQNGGSKNPERMKQLFGDTYWYYVHFIEPHEN